MQTLPDRSKTLPRDGLTAQRTLELLASEAFSEAMGRVIAEKQKEWDRIIEVRDAEHRAVVAELRAKIIELEANIKTYADNAFALVRVTMQGIKNGEPGPAGPIGPVGERGEKGDKGDNGEQGLPGAQGDRGYSGIEGEPGKDGKDGRDGINGKDGRDGADGAGFDSWEVKYDGVRTFTFCCGSGDRKQEFSFKVPVMIDRGVWRAGVYDTGDVVSRNGSIYIAQKEGANSMPGTDNEWRLAVKHGRDGKNGIDGKPGAPGPVGPRGQDLTQLGPDGRKW